MALAKLAVERHRLVHGHLRLVGAIARRVRRELERPAELDDLVGEGMVGLLQAARRFDRRRGVEFATFAGYRIRGAMFDAARSAGRYNRREVAEFRAGAPALDVELDLPTPPVEELPAEGATDELSLARERKRALHAAVAELPPRERHFIEKVYFEGKPMMDAGAELGLSKSWASRLHARALKALRRILERTEREA